MDLTILVEFAPYILILGGLVAISWLLERIVKSTPETGESSWLMKSFSLSGFFLGILLIVTAVIAWSTKPSPVGSSTQYLMIIMGLALCLKPVKKVPLAALLGLAVGGLCAGFVFFFFPLPEVVFGYSSTWVYLLIFFIPAVLVYTTFKFVEEVLKLISVVLTSKPVKLVLGLICIVQGVLLLFDKSLFTML